MREVRYGMTSMVAGTVFALALGSNVCAETRHERLVREAMPHGIEVAKAMMSEAIMRACPSVFQRVSELRDQHQRLLREDDKWVRREIVKKAEELRREGCGRVRVMYTRLQQRYPYIRLASPTE